MHESDVQLSLGADFSYTPFMPLGNKIIRIDEKPERLERRAKLKMWLCSRIHDRFWLNYL
jgi:pyruvate dehydrogenase (quinone)